MSWYAMESMAWERTRELETAARRSQPTRRALAPEPGSAGQPARPLVVVSGDLAQDLCRVLAEPGGRPSNRKRSIV